MIRHAFTMETFTLWSHSPMSSSCTMDAPCPQGGQHLPMEPFTLAPHTMEISLSMATLVDGPVPRTKSVCKAAHRRSRVATKVSPSELSAVLLAIANPARAKLNCFERFVRFPYAEQSDAVPPTANDVKGFYWKGFKQNCPCPSWKSCLLANPSTTLQITTLEGFFLNSQWYDCVYLFFLWER